MREVRGRWLLAALFVVSLPLVNPYLRGDGNGYYAYVRSIVIDHDLEFENEFRHGDPLFRPVYFDEQGVLHPWMRSSTAHVVNQWAVGPSMLWLPFFLSAHLVVKGANLLGGSLPADGFSAPYRWSCAAGTAFYGWLAILLAFDTAARVTGARAALLAALAIWWASSLPVYMYFLPFHVHALSAFAVALFVWYWLRVQPFGLGWRRWALWGAMGGLMTAVYYLNAVVAMLAVIEIRPTGPPGGGPRARSMAAAMAAFAAGGVAALTPHFAVKWVLHGSPLATGYRDEFFWTTPRIWQVAFSAEHGMFLWTPVLLLAAAGLVLLARRDVRIGGALLAVFALFYYVVASYQNWHGQSSFGNRFFVSLTLPFVFGLAVVVDRLSRGGAGHLAWRWASGSCFSGAPTSCRIGGRWTFARWRAIR
jgi:hypothetical protein